MLKDYFHAYQDWRKDRPAKQVTIEEARLLKSAGTHYFVNHGKAIAEIPRQESEIAEEAQKSRWAAIPSGTLDIGFMNVLQLV